MNLNRHLWKLVASTILIGMIIQIPYSASSQASFPKEDFVNLSKKSFSLRLGLELNYTEREKVETVFANDNTLFLKDGNFLFQVDLNNNNSHKAIAKNVDDTYEYYWVKERTICYIPERDVLLYRNKENNLVAYHYLIGSSYVLTNYLPISKRNYVYVKDGGGFLLFLSDPTNNLYRNSLEPNELNAKSSKYLIGNVIQYKYVGYDDRIYALVYTGKESFQQGTLYRLSANGSDADKQRVEESVVYFQYVPDLKSILYLTANDDKYSGNLYLFNIETEEKKFLYGNISLMNFPYDYYLDSVEGYQPRIYYDYHNHCIYTLYSMYHAIGWYLDEASKPYHRSLLKIDLKDGKVTFMMDNVLDIRYDPEIQLLIIYSITERGHKTRAIGDYNTAVYLKEKDDAEPKIFLDYLFESYLNSVYFPRSRVFTYAKKEKEGIGFYVRSLDTNTFPNHDLILYADKIESGKEFDDNHLMARDFQHYPNLNLSQVSYPVKKDEFSTDYFTTIFDFYGNKVTFKTDYFDCDPKFNHIVTMELRKTLFQKNVEFNRYLVVYNALTLPN